MRGWPDKISTWPRSNVNHATVGAAVGDPDPHETAEIGWFAPDELPDIAFDHARQVLAAWRDAVREKRTVTPLPDRP